MRSSTRKPWQAVSEFKRKLASRDPLGVELTRLLINRWSRPSEDSQGSARIEDLRREITSKYDLEGLDLPSPALMPNLLMRSGLSEADVGGLLWAPLGRDGPLSSRTNWLLPGQIVLGRHEGRTRVVLAEERPAPPPGQARVTVKVRLGGVTHWDISRLSRDFVHCHFSGSFRQEVFRNIPPPRRSRLAFLRP